jgi:CRP/FNR family transcriptional regulator
MPEVETVSRIEPCHLHGLLRDEALEAERMPVATGTTLFDADSLAEFLFLIEQGQVRLFQAGPQNTTRLVSILGAGDWLGMSCLSDARNYGLRATAMSETVVCRVRVESVRRKLAQLPPIASELIAQLARKLREAHESAGRLVFDDCSRRLLDTLVSFAETSAASPGESGDVELRITHQQLAQAVGAARETVSLALTELRQRKLVVTGRNRLRFNPRALQEAGDRLDAREEHAGADRSEAETRHDDNVV